MGLLAGLLLANPAHGAGLATEVFSLGFRTVDEVAPMLAPLTPPPGAVTGLGNRLVVRTTPDNMAEVRDVLAAIDRPPRSLLVSIKRDTLERTQDRGAEARLEATRGDARVSAGGGPRASGGGRVIIDDGAGRRMESRVYATDRLAEDRGVQSIRTLEGRDAFISAGVEIPVHGRRYGLAHRGAISTEDTRYRHVARGFYVRPLVHGDRVLVEIRSIDTRLAAGAGGLVRRHDADTVVSGRVGEWLVVGSEDQEETRARKGFDYGAGARTLGKYTLLLKIEVLPP
ncbi:MAG: hypothetical protein U5S82_24310 [Gammaproteobacteria bacterium]|nr:hypothetical protein [Gammaproteobacteria bacterium]